MRSLLGLFLAVVLASEGQDLAPPKALLWSLKPVVRPEVAAAGRNPIDVLMGRVHAKKGVAAAGRADQATLLRRVHLDLTGLPPTVAEVDAFLADSSAGAYERVVDRLLADPQHGVRYGRHWLDVLGYSDVDEGMIAESGIHHWRDWVVSALNRDVPYDQFVRASIAGDLSAKPEDIFATGFLTRAAHSPTDAAEQLAFAAVENVSSAFLGMTTGCARCHDHMYDPISQRDFYAMKALFDPLLPDKRVLASAEEILRHPDVVQKWRAEQEVIQSRIDGITAPYEKRIFEERMATLPPAVAAVYRKDASQRSEAEKKTVLEYNSVVIPDARTYRDTLAPADAKLYESTRQELVVVRRDPPVLPTFWSVRVEAERAGRKSHLYVGGARTKKGDEVGPGFPFAPAGLKFEGDRRTAFLGWLTGTENPLLARVAVNRLWQWHFGEGIVETPSDFGRTGRMPMSGELLDWLASEFVARKYSMRAMHRLIVTSDLYQQESAGLAANRAIDPGNKYLWKFPVRRLEAEAIRDSVLVAAGTLDMTVGGRSFRAEDIRERRVMSAARTGYYDGRVNRRGIYMGRGLDGSMNMLPAYLSLFDAEDGHVTCARRERSVTAPQVLFLLNGSLAQEAAKGLARRLEREAGGGAAERVAYGYKVVLGRAPSATERDAALSYVGQAGTAKWEEFSWMLLNLSEFVFRP